MTTDEFMTKLHNCHDGMMLSVKRKTLPKSTNIRILGITGYLVNCDEIPTNNLYMLIVFVSKLKLMKRFKKEYEAWCQLKLEGIE